jgi:hypothetical protein
MSFLDHPRHCLSLPDLFRQPIYQSEWSGEENVANKRQVGQRRAGMVLKKCGLERTPVGAPSISPLIGTLGCRNKSGNDMVSWRFAYR